MSRRKEYILNNDLEINYTTIFLLPVLEYDDSFFPKEFISCYIIDKSNTQLALVFENTKSEELTETLQNFKNHSLYDRMEYDDEDREIVVIFNFPKEFDTDFRLFKIGRYSKFSNKLKEILLDRHGRMTGNGKYITMSDALLPDYKSKKFRADKIGVSINDLPNGEVMSIPNFDLEYYYKVDELKKIEKYINK